MEKTTDLFNFKKLYSQLNPKEKTMILGIMMGLNSKGEIIQTKER